MAVSVGTLVIDLRAETASFVSDMGKASQLSAKTANDIKRSLEKISAVGIAMGSAIATGSAMLIRHALDSADSLGKLAQSAGTTVETLSTLAYAAKLSGVQTDQLGVGLVRLSKAAFAAQGGNVQLERIFGRLGVTVSDSNGHLKDSGEMMQQLAVKFAATADGAGKTALATALFGKSGASLIPFLDDYGARQAKVNEQAHRFGMVLSMSTIQVAGEAKEKFAELGAAAEGFGFSVLSRTLPALNDFAGKLDQLAENGKLAEIGKKLGEEASRGIKLFGESLDFASKHAEGLKVALGALAGLEVVKIAIPAIGDLSKGGIANVGKGIDGFTKGLFGMQKVLPVLSDFAKWSKGTSIAVASLAKTEGIASASTYVLTGALTALEAPLILSGIAALGYSFYKVSEGIREASAEGVRFSDVLHALTPANLFKLGLGDSSGLAFSIEKSARPHVVDPHVVDPRFFGTMKWPDKSPKNLFDTSGLNSHPDHYGEEIKKLQLAIATQKAYLGVLDGTPEQIQAVNSQQIAAAAILAINKQRSEEGMRAISKKQAATIQDLVATQESTKAMVDYGRELVSQQHNADLSTKQTRAMAAANLESDAAVRRAAVGNAILGLTYNRTAEQLRLMSPELAKLRAELIAQSDISLVASTNKEIFGLQEQLAQRRILTAATLQGIDAQRQAELRSKLVPLDRDISDTTDPGARNALQQKRASIIALAQAQWDANDAERAASLLSPSEQYERESDALNHAVMALSAMRDGSISYGEQLGILSKQQEMFNDATDRTIQLMLGEGSATDGVKAFFLEMQKQAQTTASILYDTFNGAFNKLADGITGIMTAANGYKRRDAINQMMTSFQDLSKQMLDSSLKKGMQSGLGALGNAFGINLGTATKPDGSSSGKALWVRMASDSGAELSSFGESSGVASMLGLGKGASGPHGASFGSTGANVFSSIGGKIASLFGMGKKSSGMQGAIMPDMTSIGLSDLIPMGQGIGLPQQSMFADTGDQANMQTVRPGQSSAGGIVSRIASMALGMLIPHADGGPVSPSSAYLVGERGPEILAGASGRMFSNADSRRMLSGGDTHTHTWNVDARGSNDPAQVTAQINQALANAVPQIAAVVFHGVKDQPLRRPSMAPR